MRLSLIYDSMDRHRMWSGTTDHMVQALAAEGFTIGAIPPVHPLLTQVLDKAGQLACRLTGRAFVPRRSARMARMKGRILTRRLAGAATDVVFAPVSATLLPELMVDMPVIYASDATVPLMLDYYPGFVDWPPALRRQAIAQEARALARADLLLFPSDWAARSAVADLGADPARIRITPFGANMADAPSRADALRPRAPGPWRLLWCGVDWTRKGGADMLAALAILRADGLPVELTLVGCTPPAPIPGPLAAHVTVLPFLNKSDPAQAGRLQAIFQAADLMVLPSRAECFGVVFCEAAAFGMPSVALDTGGVAAAIQDGITGRLLPERAGASAIAGAVADLIRDPEGLARMGRAARDAYEARLNWAAWAADVAPAIRALVR